MTCIRAEKATSLQKTSGEEPKILLFVCTGNTCRSPMAAALYNDLHRPREVCSLCDADSGADSIALSAGLFANPGDPMTTEAVVALREAGVLPAKGNDYTAHRAQNVNEALMEQADLVIGISGRHAMELTLRYPQYAGKITAMPMDIADPFGQGADVYRACLMQLRMCLQLMQAEDEK
jgi:protein-tyrosine-phosphatase